MKQNPGYPDFLIIGAMKAGTTSLHDYLGKHPDIFTSDPKEIHFFMDDNFKTHSPEWYKSLFITDKKISGTSPQNYTKLHRPAVKNVPMRIYEHMPKVKLIYIVRDPISRIKSHYAEAQSGGYAPKESLNKYLQNFNNNHYVNTSMYYFQISKYLKYFKKEQILIIKSEDLLTNRLDTLNEVFRFLSVQEIQDNSLFDYKKNIGSVKQKRSSVGKVLYSKNIQFIRNFFPRKLKDYLNKNKIVNKLSYNSVSNININENLETQIRNYLKPDLIKLEEFTGKDFSSWY